jgi:hypothetical protein
MLVVVINILIRPAAFCIHYGVTSIVTLQQDWAGLFETGIAQSVVRRIGSAEVTSSILVASFTVKMAETQCL